MRKKTGRFLRGIEIAGVVHFDYEMRAPTAGDLFDAEDDAPAGKALEYEAALATRQLLRVGSFTGPFDLALLRRLTPTDFALLRSTMREFDVEDLKSLAPGATSGNAVAG